MDAVTVGSVVLVALPLFAFAVGGIAADRRAAVRITALTREVVELKDGRHMDDQIHMVLRKEMALMRAERDAMRRLVCPDPAGVPSDIAIVLCDGLVVR